MPRRAQRREGAGRGWRGVRGLAVPKCNLEVEDRDLDKKRRSYDFLKCCDKVENVIASFQLQHKNESVCDFVEIRLSVDSV